MYISSSDSSSNDPAYHLKPFRIHIWLAVRLMLWPATLRPRLW